MKVLLIGSGAREHAIGWKLLQSPNCSDLVSLPGNPGLAEIGGVIDGVSPTDVGAVAALAEQLGFDFVVIGPEGPLAAGLADALIARSIPVFGPTRSAARLESSKSFAKEIMQRAKVPTGAYAAFASTEEAKSYLATSGAPYVVKADGLAAGKGVLVTTDLEKARAWVDECLDGTFGGEGASVVIEEFLDGPELSVFAVCDGTNAIALQPARDYKRLSDHDKGPNTGGMGSYSPVADLPEDLTEQVMQQVVYPTLRVMASDGNPFVGFLYVGLALTDAGPKVIEFNTRLGDPETQVVLPLLKDDLLEILHTAATSELSGELLHWSDSAAVNVVLAASGYPTSPRKGNSISGLDEVDDDVLIFHAGTAKTKKLVTNGGRVLSLVGLGPNVPAARSAAYRAVDKVHFKGIQHRTDIAGDH